MASPNAVSSIHDCRDFAHHVPSLKRSKSIPIKQESIPARVDQEEVEMADWRDYVVFHRIATGISRQQLSTRNARSRMVNDMCLASIIGTRNLSDEELKYSHRQPQGSNSPRFESLPGRTTLIPVAHPNSLHALLLGHSFANANLAMFPSTACHGESPRSPEDETIFDLEL